MSQPDGQSEDEEPATDESEAVAAPPTGNWLSTGIGPLDRQLGGGIPPGRLVAITAPPDTQSELLLKQVVTERSSLYLSTIRPQWEVEEELRDYLQKTKGPDPGSHSLRVEEVFPEVVVADPTDYLNQLGTGANLVVDAVNELEREDGDRYAAFLNAVKRRLWDTGSVGLFYGIDEGDLPPGRAITLRRADLVWQLQSSVDQQTIDHYLVISKFRGGKAPTEPIKLVLTDEVKIDTSRNIA